MLENRQSTVQPQHIHARKNFFNQPTGSMQATVKLLDRVVYRAMTSPEDMAHLHRWRWENYMEQETIVNASMSIKEFIDGKDDLPTARTIGMYLDNELVASMRTHAINDVVGNTEVVDVGKNIIDDMLKKGVRFSYASKWIGDKRFSSNIAFVIATTRVACLAAGYHSANFALSTSRENHAKAYARIQDAEVWTNAPERIKNLDYNYHLIGSDYYRFQDRMPLDRQAYLSSHRERDEMFSPNANYMNFIKPSAYNVINGIEEMGF